MSSPEPPISNSDRAAILDRLKTALVEADSWLTVETNLRRAVPEGEEDGHRALVFAFGYMLYHEPQRRADEGPFAAAIVTDQGQFPPPLAEIAADDLETWEAAATEIDDPISRSRLHDLLWERRHGERPDMHARSAADAYVSVSENESWHRIERVDCLTRALELAQAVGDDARARHAIDPIVNFAQSDLASEDPSAGVVLTLLGVVALLDDPPAALPDLIERAEGAFGDDPYLADALTDLKISQTPEARERLRREQVERWRRSAAKGDGMLKEIRLQRALELAKTHGFKDLVEALRLELQGLKPEEFDLKTVSTSIEIPTEQVRALINSIVDKEGWERSLMRFGSQSPPGGEPDELDRRIVELMRDYPIQFLVTKVVIGSDETTTIFRADDEDSHRRLARAEQRAHAARFWSLLAVEALDVIRQRHGEPSAEEMTAFFTTELIDANAAERIAAAVLAYLDGRFDEAAHLISPRIEAVIRELARRVGIPIIREPRGRTPGRVQSLGDVLAQLRPHFAHLSAGWHAYLENLLTDPLGLNLRNVIAHGLHDRIDRLDAALLIQAACYLRLLGLSSKSGATHGESS